MKSPRRQLEDERTFLSRFIEHESAQRKPCRKLIELLHDLRFARYCSLERNEMSLNSRVMIWITCRNYEHYLDECLCSAHAQTYPCAVYVAHDDCGGENPVGVAANRNRFIEVARGFDYVIFLDADDRLPENYVAELLQVAGVDSCVVTCDAQLFGDRVERIRVAEPVNLDSLLEINTVHCSALVSVRVFLAYSGGYDESLAAFEDWALWCQLAAAGAEFRYCPTVALQYRQHADSRHHMKRENWQDVKRILIERLRWAPA